MLNGARIVTQNRRSYALASRQGVWPPGVQPCGAHHRFPQDTGSQRCLRSLSPDPARWNLPAPQAEELYTAAKAGNVARVAELLNENTPITFADEARGRASWPRPLFRQCPRHINLTSPLATAAQCGKGPLHVAAEAGHWGIVDELLKRGADVDAKSKASRAPPAAQSGPGPLPPHVRARS